VPTVARSAADRFRTLWHQLPYVPRAFRLVWEPSRGLTITWLALVVVQGVLPAVSIVFTKQLVDAVVRVLQSQGAWADVRAFLIPAVLVGTALLAQDLASAVSRYIRTAQSQTTAQHIDLLVHRKAVSVDLAFYDSAEYYDRLHRARSEAASTPFELLGSIGRLLQSGITLVATAAVLVVYAWWLPFVVFISTLPGLVVALRYIFAEHELTQRQTTDTRLTWYYDDLLTGTSSAAEVRLFGIGEHYVAQYQRLKTALRRDRLKLVRGNVIAEGLSSMFAMVLMVGTLVWFAIRAMAGRYTLGDLALLYQAYGTGQSLLGSLHGNIGAVYRNMLYLNNLFEYLDMKSSLRTLPQPVVAPRTLEKGIQFENVTFGYPGSPRIALQRFNLTIGAGDAVAIVGENGAGKSTLTKLLCRFYDPQEGRITIDGVDLRDYSIESLREMFSVLFQDPVYYYESVTSNVTVSTAHAVADVASVRRAVHEAGAEAIVARLPQGYDTILGRMFPNGTQLSTGEWQRVALARAYLRQAPILILDEPTSAMDPWSEAEWLRQLRELERGRTTIIVSHRFSVAMHATRIHVMHHGGIIEAGTHDELLARRGKYAAGWETLLAETR